MRGLILPALLTALIFAVACERSSTAGSPTSPGNAARLEFLATTTSSHAIRKAKLTFDGRDVATVEIPGGGGQVAFKETVSATRGAHIIRIVILDQASSPNPYLATGAVTTMTRVLDLAPVQGVLATGEALEFRVDF